MAAPLLLVFEDDADTAMVLAAYLGGRGYRVVLAEDGSEASALVTRHRPDAVVMDVGMPGKNGLEACREIRADGSAVPIVMLSARVFAEDAARALAAGADAYLTKGFDPAQVEAELRRLLPRKAPC